MYALSHTHAEVPLPMAVLMAGRHSWKSTEIEMPTRVFQTQLTAGLFVALTRVFDFEGDEVSTVMAD